MEKVKAEEGEKIHGVMEMNVPRAENRQFRQFRQNTTKQPILYKFFVKCLAREGTKEETWEQN